MNSGLRFLHVALLLLITVVLYSCRTQKKIVTDPVIVKEKDKEKDANFLFGQLKNNELKFNFLTVKIEAETKNEKETNSFNVNLRIKKDSIIWMTISAVSELKLQEY